MIDTFLMMGLKAKIGVNWKILLTISYRKFVMKYPIIINLKLFSYCGKFLGVEKLLNASKLLMRLSFAFVFDRKVKYSLILIEVGIFYS